jgi:predicted ThiF/HesA family dinucleotide-utilizing enzyme
MKLINLLKTAFTITILIFFTSCSKDEDKTQVDSRNVKYEITGNATGTYDTTYITGSGSGTNETPNTLPWSKEIILQENISTVSINAAVIGATTGKTITAKIYVGGIKKKEETATVQSNGIAIISGLNYTLD